MYRIAAFLLLLYCVAGFLLSGGDKSWLSGE